MTDAERRAKITTAAIDKFEVAIAAYNVDEAVRRGMHRDIAQAQLDAMRSQRNSLLEELEAHRIAGEVLGAERPFNVHRQSMRPWRVNIGNRGSIGHKYPDCGVDYWAIVGGMFGGKVWYKCALDPDCSQTYRPEDG